MHHDSEDDIAFERGSGNVFADIGLPDSTDHFVKANLVVAIESIVEDHGWTQAEAADRTGVKQPDVSNLFRGKFDGFSQERLQTILRRLGVDVKIRLHRNGTGIGTIRVRQHA